ncbi:hypothetical protein B0H13DRAFT_1851231 [Mycena leptocephala]|nr:hypothetical protein B0H13DRAFT_1851231 [Mycena leptocephala]
MINHHGDWNNKKTMNLASDLAEDILEAKAKYIAKRNHFIDLSISFKDRITQWKKILRTTYKLGKEAIIPSQQAIYDKMIADDDNFGPTLIAKTKIAQFMQRALQVEDSQRTLRQLIHDTSEHELASRTKELASRRSKLRTQLSELRQQQKHVMPQVGDKVASQAISAPAIEAELLYLPSDFSEAERREMNLVQLAIEEARWREGQAFDTLRALQNVVKALRALQRRKFKNNRQQKQNTRAMEHIDEGIKRRNHHMEAFNAARLAIITLTGSSNFPILTEADLFMKSVQQKRQVGDSNRTDGLLFRAKALATVGSYDGDVDGGIVMNDSGSDVDEPTVVGTQMDRRRSGPKPKKHDSSRETTKTVTERPEGWLWQLGKLTKMSNNEMEAWSNEGDRVQWFRAEAEMQRWQEQWEQKLVELLRTARSFSRMQAVWTQLSKNQPQGRPGARAYALQKAAMYEKRWIQAHKNLRNLGFGHLLGEAANVIEFVEQERKKEADILNQAIGTGL